MLTGGKGPRKPSHKQKRREKQDYLSDHNELGKHHFLHAYNVMLHSCLVCVTTAWADLSVLIATIHDLFYGFTQYLSAKLRCKPTSRRPATPSRFLVLSRQNQKSDYSANIADVTITSAFHQRIIHLVNRPSD